MRMRSTGSWCRGRSPRPGRVVSAMPKRRPALVSANGPGRGPGGPASAPARLFDHTGTTVVARSSGCRCPDHPAERRCPARRAAVQRGPWSDIPDRIRERAAIVRSGRTTVVARSSDLGVRTTRRGPLSSAACGATGRIGFASAPPWLFDQVATTVVARSSGSRCPDDRRCRCPARPAERDLTWPSLRRSGSRLGSGQRIQPSRRTEIVLSPLRGSAIPLSPDQRTGILLGRDPARRSRPATGPVPRPAPPARCAATRSRRYPPIPSAPRRRTRPAGRAGPPPGRCHRKDR